MEKHLISLTFVLALLLVVSGSFSRSGRVEAVQESITVDECKISCKTGSPKLLNGKWTCVDLVQMKVSTPQIMSSSKDGCDGLLVKCQGMYCHDLTDCGPCCGGTQAPFCFRHKCACW